MTQIDNIETDIAQCNTEIPNTNICENEQAGQQQQAELTGGQQQQQQAEPLTEAQEMEIERQAMEYHNNKDSGNWLAVKQICAKSRETDSKYPRLIDYLENEVFDTVIEHGEVDVNNLYRAIQFRDSDGNMYNFTGAEMLHMLDNFHIPVPETSNWPMSVIKQILFRYTPEDNCNIELFVYTDEVVVCIGNEWMNAYDTDSRYCTVIPRNPDVDVHRYI